MQFDSFSDPDAAAVFDFLSDYQEDVEGGGARPLREYLARYPDAEEAVAAEYLRLQQEAAEAAGDPDTGADPEPGGSDSEREQVGPYRVLRELGQGGQGRVVLAEDSRIERRVALKILDAFFLTEERRERFRREAEVIARLSHPGICAIHEAEIDGDQPYIAMQFVAGEVLSAALERARANAQRPEGEREKSVFVELPWMPASRTELHRVLHFFERAARALHAAHEAGVVHRDVKPANIAVGGDAWPVLLDFGLAADQGAEDSALTRTGDVFGTPAYMSPEQLRGERAAIDRRTDVYSLGAALFEALTGERPFRGETRFELERAILGGRLEDPRQHNRALDEDVKVLLETALERDPQRRYATALELAEDLRRVREFEPIRARPAGPGLRFRRWARRQPALAAVLITSFVLLTGALVHARFLLGREQRANRFAQGRHYAERSAKLLAEDPVAAFLVAIEAVELAPGYLTRSALYAPLEACFLRRVLSPAESVRRAYDLDLAPDGETLAVGLANGELHLWPTRWDPEAGERAARGERSEARTAPTRLALDGETAAVRDLAFHPDGRLLAAGYESGHLQLWDLEGEAPLAHATLSSEPLLWVEFSPRGDRLVVQPADGPARVLALPDLTTVCSLDTGPLESGCARFSPDGTAVLTSSRGMRGLPLTASEGCNLWDAESGEVRARFAGPGAVQWAELSPSGERVVAAFEGGEVLLWDVASGRRTGEPLLHSGRVHCATFSPDGAYLITTTDDGTESRGVLWDLRTRTRTVLDGHEGNPVVHAAFAPDGRMFATASFDRTVRLFATDSGQLQRTLRARFRPLRIRWSRDGRQLFTLSNSADVHVWAVGNQAFGYRLRGHRGDVVWSGFTPDGTRVVTASRDGNLRVWWSPARAPGSGERESGTLLGTLADAGAPWIGARFLPDGQRVAAWGEDGRLAVFDLDPGDEVCGKPGAVVVHPSPVARVDFDPAGERYASVDRDGRGRLGELAGGAADVAIEGPSLTDLAFTPDGSRIVALSGASEVQVLDAIDGRVLSSTPFTPARAGSEGAVAVAFHPILPEMAVACADGRVRFFDTETGGVRREERALFQLSFLRYSPDGRRLLVLGNTGGGSVRVLDLEGPPKAFGVEAQLTHKSRIMSATFDPAGEWVLTASLDGTSSVWSAVDGSIFAHHTLHDGAVLWAAFSPPEDGGAIGPAGLRVVSASADGTAAVWPVDPYPAARMRRPRELRDWERAREEKLAQPPE